MSGVAKSVADIAPRAVARLPVNLVYPLSAALSGPRRVRWSIVCRATLPAAPIEAPDAPCTETQGQPPRHRRAVQSRAGTPESDRSVRAPTADANPIASLRPRGHPRITPQPSRRRGTVRQEIPQALSSSLPAACGQHDEQHPTRTEQAESDRVPSPTTPCGPPCRSRVVSGKPNRQTWRRSRREGLSRTGRAHLGAADTEERAE